MLIYITELLQRLVWLPIRVLFFIFLHYRVSGVGNVLLLKRRKAGIIFASNHAWELDPIFIASALPFFSNVLPLFFVSLPASEYKHLGPWAFIAGGSIFKAWGAYPALIGQQDLSKTLAHHLRLLQKRKNVCIFPEGMLRRAALYPPPKPGVSYLAAEAGATIIPVRLRHSGPFSAGKFFTWRLSMSLTFGKPLALCDLIQEKTVYTLEDHRLVAHRLMEKIRDL
ncbi:MAG: hypothetical protein COV10_03000 [Candidatus Vogelbacteria bacterium CG10_big_fil_rev_8_21_14_0_10_51_16]|uniref:Phospholipid/glycerol acyltransferase domain-containing protein n=1 Tax=Candidatus Vogelbacteria bacterium CG10_big_fil_rev_8_21_14_0_10_51_16 TaxID=1975045 RepID=A0A2H0REL1_9BACT|nr:MAG: hypothetical protein COV10_03000 [Candidatus Vogelbacteria bacterium CG10_big_fil_rev_8_21_14_0_10_51_16]